MGLWERLFGIKVEEAWTTQTVLAAHACDGCQKQPSVATLSEHEFVVLCLNNDCEHPRVAEHKQTEEEAIDAWSMFFARPADVLQREAFTQTGARARFKKEKQ